MLAPHTCIVNQSIQPIFFARHARRRSLKDHADKIGDDVKEEVESAIKEANEAKEGDDLQKMKDSRDKLNAATSKIGQAIYGQAKAGEEGEEKKDEETVDAEFTDKEKKEESK